MKVSSAAPKIVGVQLASTEIEYRGEERVLVKAKFALLSKEGDVLGVTTMPGGWSEKLEAPLRAFIDALEEEGLRVIFEQQSSETPQTSPKDEPQQF